MGIKDLGFEEVRKRAENFRKIAEEWSTTQQFNTGSAEAERFLEENSLAPIVGTICDQQITAEDAWNFPYWLSEQQKGKSFSAQFIHSLGKAKIEDLLGTYMEDKWPSGMGQSDLKKYLDNISNYIVNTCRLIADRYDNDPDNIFKEGKYIVPEVYFSLRVLPGIGPKKASMIARDFVKGEGAWYRGICKRLKGRGINFMVTEEHLSEVPIDVQVVKVFGRVMGEFKKTPPRERFLDYWPDIQNFAKLTFPDFPGKIDQVLWAVGREYCKERQPNCERCPLKGTPCDYGGS